MPRRKRAYASEGGSRARRGRGRRALPASPSQGDASIATQAAGFAKGAAVSGVQRFITQHLIMALSILASLLMSSLPAMAIAVPLFLIGAYVAYNFMKGYKLVPVENVNGNEPEASAEVDSYDESYDSEAINYYSSDASRDMGASRYASPIVIPRTPRGQGGINRSDIGESRRKKASVQAGHQSS